MLSQKYQSKNSILRLLIEKKILSQNKAINIRNQAIEINQPIIAFMLKKQLISAYDLALIISEEYGYPLFDIDCLDIQSLPHKLIEPSIIRKYQTIPIILEGKKLHLATRDPFNQEAFHYFCFSSNLIPTWLIVEDDKLTTFIQKHFAEPFQSCLIQFKLQLDYGVNINKLKKQLENISLAKDLTCNLAFKKIHLNQIKEKQLCFYILYEIDNAEIKAAVIENLLIKIYQKLRQKKIQVNGLALKQQLNTDLLFPIHPKTIQNHPHIS